MSRAIRFSCLVILILLSVRTLNGQEPEERTVVKGRVEALVDEGSRKEPVSGAVVYLESLPPEIPLEVPDTPVQMVAQIDEGFDREWVVVQAGQSLVIWGLDEPAHTFHPGSQLNPGDIAPWNWTNPQFITCKNPELLFPISCDIHPIPSSYVTVVPNQVHAFSLPDGSFRLPLALPPGNYRLCAFKMGYGTVKKELVLKPGDREVSVEFQKTVRP